LSPVHAYSGSNLRGGEKEREMFKFKKFIYFFVFCFLVLELGFAKGDGYIGDMGVLLITPDYFPQSMKDASPQMRVVTRKEIEKKQPASLADALSSELGISEISQIGTLGSLSTLSMRGGSDNEVRILMDGVPVNAPSNGRVDISNINMEYVERIEIMRGGSSYLYGGNSVGGVINIITKRPHSDSLSVKTNVGSFDFKTMNLSGAKYFEKNYLYFSLDGKDTLGWRKNSDCQEKGFFVKAGNDKNNWSFRFFDNDMGTPGSNKTALEDWDGELEREASSLDARQKKRNLQTSINLTSDKRKVLLSYMNNNLDSSNPSGMEDNEVVWHKAFVSFKSKTFIKGFDVGVEAEKSIYAKNDYFIPDNSVDKERTVLSLLGQQKINLAGIQNIFAVRYDSSRWGDVVSPRVIFLKKISDFKVSLSLATSFNPPKFNDLYWKGGHGIGNPDLEPEKSRAADLSMEFRKERFLYNTSVFYALLDDKIVWILDEVTFMYKPYNLDNVRNFGVENEARYFVLSNLEFKAGYTYLMSQVDNDGWELLRYAPQHKGAVSLNYSPVRSLSLGINARGQSRCWSSDGESGTKIPVCMICNLVLQKSFSNLKLFAKVNNVFDKRYLSRKNYPLPGRTYAVGMDLELIKFN
jgi:outer membrane cobalamin receptor